MEDKSIIDMYFSRNEEAITQTQAKYGRYCHSIAYNILGDIRDCEECVNDTYMALWKSIPPKRPNVFSAYIAKITRNISLKRYREKNTQKRGGGEVALTLDELYECIPAANDPQSSCEYHELTAVLESFLRSLDSDDRYIFMRRYWYFDSIVQICEKTADKESAVKMKLMRLRQKLKKRLEEEEFYL